LEQKDLDLLTAVSREKFHRRMQIATKLLIVAFLVVMIFFSISFLDYSKHVGAITFEYGDLGYCYLCGELAGRSCNCAYLPQLMYKNPTFDLKEYKRTLGTNNIAECMNQNEEVNESIFSFS